MWQVTFNTLLRKKAVDQKHNKNEKSFFHDVPFFWMFMWRADNDKKEKDQNLHFILSLRIYFHEFNKYLFLFATRI